MVQNPSNRRPADESQIQSILDKVDQQEASAPGKNRRAHARHTYRQLPINVRVTQPGGGVIDVGVAGRELSAGGMSFLYRGFLHAGTEVRLNLTRRAGGHETVESSVVWCRHIVGPHHLIGVKFRQRIYPALFAESAQDSDQEALPVDPSKLRGSILLIDDQELDRMLFEHHIKATTMKVTAVGNMDSALAAAKRTAFDLILCDLNLGVIRGEEVIRGLIAQGYRNPVIALTAENSPARIAAAQAAGAQCVVFKPYDPQALLANIASVLSSNRPEESNDPIHSEMAGNPGADALIAQCIEKVQALSNELQKAIDGSDFDRVRSLAQTLKGTGSGFGFSPLSSAAKMAVDTLDASKTIEKSADELRSLESICNRLTPGKAPPAAK